ncbi:hypothetical protein [Methanolobus bombayensis]|uniref:hypothetical protein n=1 Tax=Methanolobus bombayensis TaxID=38023 RepID=UPI001AE71645|nr:hypothetical protein [Methanolobus bombayensis]MBP1909973.1 hypothetical protein [Methanolobus bombayensis]
MFSSTSLAEESENYDEIEKIIIDAAREIKPDIGNDGVWYVDDDIHLGLVYFSESNVFRDEMKSIDYWDMEERMFMGENPEWTVSSNVEFTAPTPYGTVAVVTVDGYNVPLSEIQPVAENIFSTLVERSIESGAIGEGATDNSGQQEEDTTGEDTDNLTDTPASYIEDEPLKDTTPENPGTSDDNAEYEDTEFTEYDDEPTDTDDPGEEITDMDELFLIYDILEEEGLVESEGEIDVNDIDKQDIEDIQNIQMNYVLSDEFVESMQEQAKIIDIIRGESSGDIDKLDEIDTSGEQEVGFNKDIIKDVFGDDFNFEGGSSVSVGGGPDYEGKEKVAEKLSDTIYLDAIDKTRKESIEKLKTGHEAASFFSDTYGDSKIAKNFEKLDKLNSVKEEVDKYYGAYKDTKKLSEMKGSSATTAKALYAVSKGGQEVADKIPVVGDLVKTGLEVTEKVVMVVPELDNAIKNSDARQGVITNGPIGTSTPNAFLDSYGKVTQTSDGPSYSMPYTDEKGEEHEINPYQWVKVTTKGETYYIPTDEWENPIGDVALKDTGSSWKPWKWDNCQVVKRSNPKVTYNNGEEYDL